MLQKSQKEALGIKRAEQVQPFVWNQRLGKVYEPIDETNLAQGGEGQTYPEFLEMQKRPPNEEGTGRFKISHYDKIEVIFISQANSISPSRQIKANICSFLSTSLRLKCLWNTKIKLEVDKHNHIVDKKTGVFYETKSQNSMIDAHDILSVLLEYQDEKAILLAFIEKDIHQQGYEIDGRAYGDGVATVCYNMQDMNERTLFLCQTALHETLHTLGFDHCVAWKCLMNSYTNFQAWLCPACSRKIYHQLDFTSTADTIKWVKEVLGVLAKLNARQSIRKGNKIIKSLS